MTPSAARFPMKAHMLLPFQVRDAAAADAEEIAAVHASSLEAVYRGIVPDALLDGLGPDERVRRWREVLADPVVTTLVGEVEGTLTGLTSLRPSADADLDSARFAEMSTLYIAPQWWRRGQGSALCRAMFARARAGGFEAVSVWVLELNPRARAFYRGLGFAADGGEKKDDGPVPNDLIAHRYRLKLDRLPDPA